MVTKIGTAGNNTLRGTPADDTLYGKRGDDTLIGKGGNDHLYGGGGHDHVRGGPGDDWLEGNKGNDTITGDDGNDRIWGHAGADVLGGGAGDDIIRGGGGADTLFGDGGDNQLYGGKGEDLFALSPDLPGSSVAVDFSYEQGDRILLDVDTNGNGHLDPAERQIYLDLMDRLDFDVQGNETVVTLLAAGSALTPAAPGDDAPVLRLSEPIQGALPGLAVYAFGANGEEQLPTNPSRSSDEAAATLSPALSADGRFLAVTSQFDLDNTGEQSLTFDVFVIDKLTDRAVRVNTGFTGGAGDFPPQGQVAISDDGRFVAFLNVATDPQADEPEADLFVKDMLTGQIRPVAEGLTTIGEPLSLSLSLSADGSTVAFVSGGDAFVSAQGSDAVLIPVPADAVSVTLSADARHAVVSTIDDELFTAELGGASPDVRFLSNGTHPDLSADGRFVVYDQPASDQVLRSGFDGSGVAVVGGRGGPSESLDPPSISADGRFVAFTSGLEDLVLNDTNGRADAFVKDMENGRIARVSIDVRGEQGFGADCDYVSISDDGQFVALVSRAPNLQDLFIDAPPNPDEDDPGGPGRTVIWSPVDFDRVAMPDVRGDAQTDSVLPIGGSFQSDIAAFADIDFARVEPNVYELYEIVADGAPCQGSTVNAPFIALMGGSAQPVSSGPTSTLTYWSGDNSAVLFVGVAGNPRYLNDDPNSDFAFDMFLGDYTVNLQAIDIPDGPTSPATLAIGGSLRQTLDQAGDRDWYRVELEAGQDYRFLMRGASSDNGSLSDPVLKLYDADGAPQQGAIEHDDVLPGSNLDSLLEFTAPATTSYFVSAEGFDAATGTYELIAQHITSPALSPLATLVEAQPVDNPSAG